MRFTGQMIGSHPALADIRRALRGMAFKDIDRASRNNAKMGAFILGACMVDCMAGFWHGHKEKGTSDGEVFKVFVRKFLPMYDAAKLYHDLRCRLVHNYSEGGSYIFAYDLSHLHGTRENGKTIVNLEQFIADLKEALDSLLHELDTNSEAQFRAIQRWKQFGILKHKRIK